MNLVKTVDWLKERLTDPDIVIADCRFVLGDPEAGRREYERGHIPGAVYFDLERDLSGEKGAHGGRHPLPDLAELAQKLGRAGIDAAKTVVAYDDQGGAMASRFWWLLQYAGHKACYVLNGGFTLWKSSGYPVTAEIPQPLPRTFVPRVQTEMLASMEDVKTRLHDSGTILIDSREKARYLGEVEPIDPVAGHIPGAKNYDWKDGLNERGEWKPAAEQANRFRHLDASKQIIVYCGSGVTACPNFIALKEAGFRHVKLYAGSWSDWISHEGNLIATGEE